MHEGQFSELPIAEAVIGTYFHHLAPIISFSDARNSI